MSFISKGAVGLVTAVLVGLVLTACGSGSKQGVSSTTGRPRSSTTTVATAPPSTTGVSTTTSTSAATTSACRNGQVSVSPSTIAGALGHQDSVLSFTNQSQSTCTLSGYPGVAGLDAQGNQAVQAERTPSGYMGGLRSGTTASQVPLAPGQAASAIVEGTDNPVGSATSCPDYPALLVTPPNTTQSVKVTVSSEPGGLAGCSPIQVHPIVPGTSGSN